jgi:hypothetical protein
LVESTRRVSVVAVQEGDEPTDCRPETRVPRGSRTAADWASDNSKSFVRWHLGWRRASVVNNDALEVLEGLMHERIERGVQ